MRRIYALLWIISLVGIYYLGYHNGMPVADVDGSAAIIKRADSLQALVDASKLIEQEYADKTAQALVSADSLNSIITKRDSEAITTRKYYEKRIKDLEKYSADQLDSFFIARYPRPGVRISTGNDGKGAAVEIKDDGANGSEIRFSDRGEQQADERLQGYEAGGGITPGCYWIPGATVSGETEAGIAPGDFEH